MSALKFHSKRTDTTLVLSLPSSLEKEFNKIPYSKGLSFLIKNKKIDFCLIFVISKQRLKEILDEVIPYVKEGCVLWVSFPKGTSKIVTSLKTNDDWQMMRDLGYDKVVYLVIDGVWAAFRFIKVTEKNRALWEKTKVTVDLSPYINGETEEIIALHPLLEKAFEEYTLAYEFFKTLTHDDKKNYLYWIHAADKDIILNKRIQNAISKMNNGILNPFLVDKDY